MGVVNVTPDSFSDGGLHLDPAAAVAHARSLISEGADIVDVGGESTRPGATRLDPTEERRRVIAVVETLASEGIAVSIDTMNADTALAAVGAGALVVNDVSGGLADAAMLPTVAELGVPYVCMHWRGHADRMNSLAVYDDVVTEVRAELAARLDACERAGIDPRRVVLDPGIGFAKEAAHNWALLHHLDRLAELGRPLLIGASRKRFLGSLLADPSTGEPRPTGERDAATAAVAAIAAASGVWAVRVHAVAATRDAVAVGTAWRHG
ncbi:MAG: dihydropteroate synthase [Acidimicrobiaceae bacterium]|nr:dihydropteroate synthase [Acidimicrobiaceae bacterium]